MNPNDFFLKNAVENKHTAPAGQVNPMVLVLLCPQQDPGIKPKMKKMKLLIVRDILK